MCIIVPSCPTHLQNALCSRTFSAPSNNPPPTSSTSATACATGLQAFSPLPRIHPPAHPPTHPPTSAPLTAPSNDRFGSPPISAPPHRSDVSALHFSPILVEPQLTFPSYSLRPLNHRSSPIRTSPSPPGSSYSPLAAHPPSRWLSHSNSHISLFLSSQPLSHPQPIVDADTSRNIHLGPSISRMWVDLYASFGPVSHAIEAKSYTKAPAISAPAVIIKVEHRGILRISDGINNLFRCLTHLSRMSGSFYYATVQFSTYNNSYCFHHIVVIGKHLVLDSAEFYFDPTRFFHLRPISLRWFRRSSAGLLTAELHIWKWFWLVV